jgi:hypothetical protein
LIGMIDPPRAEAIEAVTRAKAAGLRPPPRQWNTSSPLR